MGASGCGEHESVLWPGFRIASQSPNGVLALNAPCLTSASRKTRHRDVELACDARQFYRDRIGPRGGCAITELAIRVGAPTVGDSRFIAAEAARRTSAVAEVHEDERVGPPRIAGGAVVDGPARHRSVQAETAHEVA